MDDESIHIWHTEESRRAHPEKVEHLRQRFAWPVTFDLPKHPHVFYADDTLQYRDPRLPSLKPLFVDFLGGKLGHRRKFGPIGKNQMLARAVGVRENKPFVLDVTAGLAADAFALLGLGCRVVALEREPLLVALVADAVKRAQIDPELYALFRRFEIKNVDAEAYLKTLRAANPDPDPRPDVIYMDPMFPEKRKTALSGREMQYLQSLQPADPEAESAKTLELLTLALTVAQERVVVKRPLKAAPLLTPVVSQFKGQTVRYDMYLTEKAAR